MSGIWLYVVIGLIVVGLASMLAQRWLKERDRCTATTRADGIVRCSLPAGHEGGHLHEFEDGMAQSWVAPRGAAALDSSREEHPC